MQMVSDAMMQHDDEALAAALLAEARTARAASQIDHAEHQLDQVLRLNAPEQNAEARLLRAQWLIDADRIAEAEELLGEADKAAMSLGSCDLMLEVSAVWARANHLSFATRACHHALNLLDAEPEDVDGRQARFLRAVAHVQLANLAQRADSPADHERFLRAALDANDPDLSPLAALELAVLRGNQGRFPAADGLLRRAMRYEHPEVSPEAEFELASQYAYRGALAGARTLFTDVRDHSGNEHWSQRAREAQAALERTVPQMPASRIGNPADHHPRVAPLLRGKRHVIIVGAGIGGQYIVEELLRDDYRRGPHRVLGFVEDFPSNAGVVDQFEYLGLTKDLPRTLNDHRAHEVWMAMPTAPPSVKREVAIACADAFVPLKTLPILHELLRSSSFVDQLRPVRIDDLIGPVRRYDERSRADAGAATRDRVDIDHHASSWLLKKVVMIVGCGSVGCFLARAAADAHADAIVLVDRSDTVLRNLRKELQEGRGCRSVRVQKSSSIDARAMLHAANEHEVQVLLYAAGMPSDEGLEPDREPVVKKAFTLLSRGLGALPKLEHIVWRTSAEAPSPDSIASRLAADAEQIVVGARAHPGLTKCAVRLPSTLSPTSSLVAGLEHDIERGLSVTVPAGDHTHRFVQGYRAAELMLHAAQLAHDREIFGVDSGIELSVRHVATELFRLRGRTTNTSRQLRESETTEWSDAPRPSGRPTPVKELIRLGLVADAQVAAPTDDSRERLSRR
jgi:nucleoside-diphosphate-sugar epimerase/tetratricopeptide (TPR) repeat protein